MVWNNDGFLIPHADETTCIHCGLCLKQCIAMKPTNSDQPNNASCSVYAAWSTAPELQNQSSSGGIFSALALEVIKQNGIVYGVIWENPYDAVFSSAESAAELASMRGSKYTQAIPGKVYQNVLTQLKKGRQVLFAGTSCQVHALKKYIKKPYDNLLCIDIVCHGVPSRLLLNKYIKEAEANSKKTIHHISFRDKPEGWRRFHVTRHYTDKTTDSLPLGHDNYMRLFLSDKILNQACYDCPYIKATREGDISLGDFWGIETYHPEAPLKQGVSAVITNTAKGTRAFLKLKEKQQINFIQEAFEHLIPHQAGFRRHVQSPPYDRHLVLKELHKLCLPKIIDKYIDSEKIGPLRFRTGSRLHQYALKLRSYWRKAKIRLK